MMHGKLAALSVGMLLAAMSAAGCQDHQKQIRDLNLKVQDLEAANGQLNSQIQSAEADYNAKLLAKDDQVRAMEYQLAERNVEIEGLKKQLNQQPTPSKSAEGWMAGTFGDSVTLASDLLFQSGKAKLSDQGKKRLDQIVKDLKSSYNGMPVRVYGHTDSDPIRKSPWADNLELSANRAMAVTRYLVTKGVNAKLVESIALGEHHPTGSEKSRNRRVEIVVVKASPGPVSR
jgi:chemotaxis protein MotB